MYFVPAAPCATVAIVFAKEASDKGLSARAGRGRIEPALQELNAHLIFKVELTAQRTILRRTLLDFTTAEILTPPAKLLFTHAQIVIDMCANWVAF